MGGFTIAAALVPGENSEANGLADAYSIAGMYSISGLYLSAALEAGDGNIDAIGADGADLTQYRLGAGWDGGSWKVGGVYEAIEIDNPGVGDSWQDSTSYNVNAGFKVGSGMIKAKYFNYEDDSNEIDNHDGFAVGYDHNLSNRTQVSAMYVASNFSELNDADVSVLSLQINHDF